MNTNYQSNSNKSKRKAVEDKNKIDKIVKGKVKTKKKNGILSSFINDDLQDIKKYIVEDVLIPTIKKTITDVVKNSIDMFFYGEVSRPNRGNSSRISYSAYYDRDREPRRRRNSLLIDDIVLESRAEAEEVLDRLDEMIEEFGMASVLNLYDLIGVTAPFTADKYGWTDIRNATAVRVRDGYLLKLPRVMPLD